MSEAPQSAEQARPVSVTIASVLALAFGVLLATRGVLMVDAADGNQSDMTTGITDLALAALAFIVSFGAFRVKRWAWVVFMTWSVVVITLHLLRIFFFDEPTFWRLALGTVAVFLLTPLDVQIAFGVRKPTNGKFTETVRNPVDGI